MLGCYPEKWVVDTLDHIYVWEPKSLPVYIEEIKSAVLYDS